MARKKETSTLLDRTRQGEKDADRLLGKSSKKINGSIKLIAESLAKTLEDKPSAGEVIRWAVLYKGDGNNREDVLKSRELAADMGIMHSMWGDIEGTEEQQDAFNGLRQMIDIYGSRERVKSGKLAYRDDIEPDGWPSTSRGTLCYLHTPVRDLPGEVGDWLDLRNPRTGGTDRYEVLATKNEAGLLQVRASKNGVEPVVLIDRSHVEDAWDCLFEINHEIYGGWWNRTLEFVATGKHE